MEDHLRAPILSGLCLALCFFPLACERNRSPAQTTASYVAPHTCNACHPAQWATYQKTGMARSFYKPGPSNVIEDYTGMNRFAHQASGRHYEMVQRDGRFLQRRWQTDTAGNPESIYELPVDFIIGSGNHARTYLHSSNGELIQLPVSWYPAEGRWGMSPGYDHAKHPDFRRRIDFGCMFCHNAYPRLSESAGRYGSAVRFPEDLPAGIDCQRCHGPGSQHVERAQKGGDAAATRAAIVNPARLAPERRMDICLQCHLETTSEPLPASTRRFGRAVFSFRPGEALTDYAVLFDHQEPGHRNKFEINGAGYRLRQSACYPKSEGRLSCTTCHNPHHAPRGAAAIAHYDARCRQCHPKVEGALHRAVSNCAQCHMPKRRTDDAVHVVMTDHLIQRRRPSGDLLAARAEQHQRYAGPIALYYPQTLPDPDRELYLGIAHAAEGADRPAGIAALERQAASAAPFKALVLLADALAADGKTSSAASYYRRALAAQPDAEVVRMNYALTLPPLQAAGEYEAILQKTPEFAAAHYGLASALIQSGQSGRAIESLRKASHLRPDYAEAYGDLGALLADQGRFDDAQRSLAEALRIDPDLADARANLAKLLASTGKTAEALLHFRRALASDPRHVPARLNLGRLLYQTGRKAEAIGEFRHVVRINPTSVEGRLSLGMALGESGDLEGAIAEFRAVLQLQPGHPEAARNLQLALEMKGR